jgi:hypothetical protein
MESNRYPVPKGALAAVSVAACALVLVLVSAAALLRARDAPTGRRFDPAAWRASAVSSLGYSPRSRMVDDLVRNRLKAGMSRDAVYSLLGEPDYRSEIDRRSGTARYYVGRGSGTDMDPDSLVLGFSGGEALVSVSVD